MYVEIAEIDLEIEIEIVEIDLGGWYRRIKSIGDVPETLRTEYSKVKG